MSDDEPILVVQNKYVYLSVFADRDEKAQTIVSYTVLQFIDEDVCSSRMYARRDHAERIAILIGEASERCAHEHRFENGVCSWCGVA